MRKICSLRVAKFLVLIGVIATLLLTLDQLRGLRDLIRHRLPHRRMAASEVHHAESTQVHHAESTLMIDDSSAREVRARAGKVLCWVLSTPKQLDVKMKAVNETWVPRCDGHLFFAEGGEWAKPPPGDVISLDVPRGYGNLTAKVVIILQYLYRHHLGDFDWFLKGDDDAYVVVENLRYLLSKYDPRHPVYLGHPYKLYHPRGYMSGGASYVISRQALKLMVENGYRKNKCATRGGPEDVQVGKCLHNVGVASFNSRDRLGRDSFHPLSPGVHIAGPIPANQLPQDYFTMVAGQGCCSQLSISFHKVDPSLMRIMDHLLYRTTVYGRLPDLAALHNLTQARELPPVQ